MITRRDFIVAAVAIAVSAGVHASVRQDSGPVLGSTVFDWTAMSDKPTNVGSVRSVVRQRTATLDELEMHITTLKPGLASHDPHQHVNEELIIVREGTVETLSNGVWKRIGPGRLFSTPQTSSTRFERRRRAGRVSRHQLEAAGGALALESQSPLACRGRRRRVLRRRHPGRRGSETLLRLHREAGAPRSRGGAVGGRGCGSRAARGCRRGGKAPSPRAARGGKPAEPLGRRRQGRQDRLGRSLRIRGCGPPRAGDTAHAVPYRQRLENADRGSRRPAVRARAHRSRCAGPDLRSRISAKAVDHHDAPVAWRRRRSSPHPRG